ncbi:hypothetical protein FACS189485_20660 [Spirochaetia bacterium]|nr:hypothetical protein FACS189485_20660 [Spirochaetia bacterium]
MMGIEKRLIEKAVEFSKDDIAQWKEYLGEERTLEQYGGVEYVVVRGLGRHSLLVVRVDSAEEGAEKFTLLDYKDWPDELKDDNGIPKSPKNSGEKKYSILDNDGKMIAQFPDDKTALLVLDLLRQHDWEAGGDGRYDYSEERGLIWGFS